ncbi:activator of HSP90 ATPase [Actinoplanes ianthinogenes]|uniref:Activator of HSP90 ATPase n=1 Tax=Actinoplanes ianthinogenes TaxID=122358 RepID=A0ABN6C797_9ACTN|nr:SRPBCC domain-containing protein [Actinoplanes ianthinogenes]BCJ40373.1 activator of HSP90 ATPase [Actinoplanes ianthinogenes]GGR11775.1 activator of HSP90 ATPase [Actinoplanes ianthinogenes]
MTDLVITRIFDAPRDLVYRAFVDPDQLAAWFGPVGWSVPRDSIDIDPRPGGNQKFTMVNDADPSMTSPVNATFVEVVENELLVGEEDVSHIPSFGADKLVMRIEFFDEEGGRTRLVLTQSPFPAAMETGAREGWGSSFTKLDKILA